MEGTGGGPSGGALLVVGVEEGRGLEGEWCGMRGSWRGLKAVVCGHSCQVAVSGAEGCSERDVARLGLKTFEVAWILPRVFLRRLHVLRSIQRGKRALGFRVDSIGPKRCSITVW